MSSYILSCSILSDSPNYITTVLWFCRLGQWRCISDNQLLVEPVEQKRKLFCQEISRTYNIKNSKHDWQTFLQMPNRWLQVISLPFHLTFAQLNKSKALTAVCFELIVQCEFSFCGLYSAGGTSIRAQFYALVRQSLPSLFPDISGMN